MIKIEVRFALPYQFWLTWLTHCAIIYAQPEASWFARVQGGDAHPLEWVGEQQSFS